MIGRSWLRGLIQRAGPTRIIFVVALGAVAAAAAGPIYSSAERTSILRDTLPKQPVSGRGYEATLTGSLTQLLNQLPPTQKQQLDSALGSLAGRDLFAPPIYTLQDSLSLPLYQTSAPLEWRTSVCAHLRIAGKCPTGANQVVVSRSTAKVTGWHVGQQLRFSGEAPLPVTGVYPVPKP